jgi:hypothetical protein
MSRHRDTRTQSYTKINSHALEDPRKARLHPLGVVTLVRGAPVPDFLHIPSGRQSHFGRSRLLVAETDGSDEDTMTGIVVGVG